jgi:hypothetical protein
VSEAAFEADTHSHAESPREELLVVPELSARSKISKHDAFFGSPISSMGTPRSSQRDSTTVSFASREEQRSDSKCSVVEAPTTPAAPIKLSGVKVQQEGQGHVDSFQFGELLVDPDLPEAVCVCGGDKLCDGSEAEGGVLLDSLFCGGPAARSPPKLLPLSPTWWVQGEQWPELWSPSSVEAV